MKKKTIFIIILLIIALALIGLYALGRNSNNKEFGEGPMTCYIEGEVLTDKCGNDVIFWEEGAAIQEALSDRSHHVRVVDGKFYLTFHFDQISQYNIAISQQEPEGISLSTSFLVEDNAHIKVQFTDDRVIVKSDGAEGRKYEEMNSIVSEKFKEPFKELDALSAELNDSNREKEFYTEDYLWAIKGYMENKNLTPAIEDSAYNLQDYYMYHPYQKYTEAGLKRAQRMDSILDAKENFRINYYAEHPMLWALYDVYFAARSIYTNSTEPGFYTENQLKQFESFMKLYDEKLCTTYPGHPVHKLIATMTGLSPGQHYDDSYDLHTADGQAVPIAPLIRGKVALIDFWVSWCGSCRVHSKDMIPIYEKYKDKGFTLIAIARERNRRAMDKAVEKDGYPWPSYLEPMDDANRVWARNGVRGGGGGMILIDRDGTILSTAYKASDLEPLIRKALGLEQ